MKRKKIEKNTLRTITQHKDLHDLAICLHPGSCNDFQYTRESSTEAVYNTSKPMFIYYDLNHYL